MKKGILVSAILDYSEHGIQPDFRGSLRIAWASIRHKLDRDDDNYARKSQVRRYAVYIRESKKDGVLPLPYEQWLASLPETSQPETSNDTNRYPTTTTTATATATSTTTATTTDCCYMPAAGKPPRQPQRLIPPTVEEVRAYAAAVGADRIRPQHKAPLRGACAGSTASRPLQRACTIQPGTCYNPYIAGGCYPPLQSVSPFAQQRHCPAAPPPAQCFSCYFSKQWL